MNGGDLNAEDEGGLVGWRLDEAVHLRSDRVVEGCVESSLQNSVLEKWRKLETDRKATY